MKKILLLICLMFTLCSCGKESKEDVLKDFVNNVNSIKSYKLTGNMEISNDEETFTYSLESSYLKDNLYKVVLVNQTNNHEQIILKNKEEIYVITPALNKSFKFQSEWPENSSQAYLLGNLVSDIKNDKKVEITESEKGYIIKSSVNYPNNEDLKYQKIYLNNDKYVEKVEVFNNNDIIKIKVEFDKVDLKASLSEKDFKLDNYIKDNEKEDNSKEDVDNNKNLESDKEIENNNCDSNSESECQQNNDPDNNLNNETDSEETANIENIIYPLYIPSNTYLTNSETIETNNGNRVILTFGGDKNFVLIEEATIKSEEMEIVPVYGEPLMLTEVIGALSANSLSWDVNNISYYLASTELTVNEMQTIANSLGNTTLVNSQK